jgi:hypothetical protein
LVVVSNISLQSSSHPAKQTTRRTQIWVFPPFPAHTRNSEGWGKASHPPHQTTDTQTHTQTHANPPLSSTCGAARAWRARR